MLPEENRVLNSLIDGGPAHADEIAAIVRLVMRVSLVVPTATDPTAEGAQLQPLLLEQEGATSMIAFTSGDAAAKVGDRAPFAVTMTGAQVAQGLGEDIGLVIDTGSAALALPPADVARALRDSTVP